MLVLASTGDMALANTVAQAQNVDFEKVRRSMAVSRNHWANKAASSTLLICHECRQLGWPDCDCGNTGRQDDLALTAKRVPEYALNYSDKPQTNKALLWHQRLGHLPKDRMLAALKDGGAVGIQGLTKQMIVDMPWCEICAATKQTRRGHPRRAKGRSRTSVINFTIHTDTMERAIPSIPPGRFTKIQTFVDEATRWLWIGLFRDKSAATFNRVLEEFEARAQIQQRQSVQWKGDAGTPVLGYFSDNAGELIGAASRRRLAEKLIKLTLSTPHESQANGIAERANGSILEATRVLLHQAELPLPFWALAAQHAVYLLNRSPTRGNPGNKSPYEMYYGKPPDKSKLRRFGCRCWVWLRKENRKHKSKIEPTARPMLFCGYNDNGSQGFKVWGPCTQNPEDPLQPPV